MARLIIGCGYVGERIARRWLADGEEVLAITRSTERAKELSAIGILPIVWDWQHSSLPAETTISNWLEIQQKLASVQTVLVAVSHANSSVANSSRGANPAGNPAPATSTASTTTRETTNAHPAGLQHLSDLLIEAGVGSSCQSKLAEVQSEEFPIWISPRWIYLSTTGVLNSPVVEPVAGGASLPKIDWEQNLDETAMSRNSEPTDDLALDESTPVNPLRPGAINAANGEWWLLRNERWTDRVVLRPTGIYGEGRVPNWRAIRDKQPLEASPESYLNLIHVDDLVSVIQHFSNCRPCHDLYCVGDNRPVLRRDYYQYISEIGQFPAPVYQESPEEAAREARSSIERKRSRGNSTKRISSERLHQEIPFRFAYPSYMEGLAALIPECIIEGDRGGTAS